VKHEQQEHISCLRHAAVSCVLYEQNVIIILIKERKGERKGKCETVLME
jgi:hypothetical protein